MAETPAGAAWTGPDGSRGDGPTEEVHGHDQGISQEAELGCKPISLDTLQQAFRQVGIPPEEIYRHYIPDVGDNSDTICIPDAAVKRFREGWESRGLGWCTEIMASKIPGCTNVICYYGSSTYDTKQMARLIDLVVEDCKQQGIETLPPEELERMALEWRQDEKGNEGDKDT